MSTPAGWGSRAGVSAASSEQLEMVWDTGQVTVGPGAVIRVGRDPSCEIVVADSRISRVHATISYAGGWVIADNHSTNGIFVAGQRVEAYRVRDQVDVLLGGADDGAHLRLSVRTPVPPPAPDPVPVADVAGLEATQLGPSPHGVGPSAPVGPAAGAPRRAQRAPEGFVGVGRAPDNAVQVADVLVSAHHAAVGWGAAGLELLDLGSLNGTYLNGQRITRAPLAEGDIITVGNSDFAVAAGAISPVTSGQVSGGELSLDRVGLTLQGKFELLRDVSFTAAPGTLTSIIGPSGAGKSTLASIITGLRRPTVGRVTFAGHDLHDSYDALRTRIGLVPQDDVVHRLLSLRQALTYAAELRLPPDMSPAERNGEVDRVLGELGLTEHADTRVDRLSGGQRKRASMAMELLTEPGLLVLDEPTSGLDPALDRQVMHTLRRLADAGRIVVVITHSLSYLDVCDQVLLLAPGGKPAFCGAPGQVAATFGTDDWAEIFSSVTADPDAAYQRFEQRGMGMQRMMRGGGTRAQDLPAPRRVSAGQMRRQLWTLSKRQLRLILADRGYLGFLALMPIVLGVLALVVPGSAGLAVAGPDAPTEAGQLLVLLTLGACFMGAAISVRDLVGERPIYVRERAVGLAPPAYLGSKVIVFGLVACLQSAILVGIILLGKPGPGAGAILPWGGVELYLSVALTAWCSAVLGLAISSVVRSSEQAMPLLVVLIMAQLVMSGGMIPVTRRAVLSQLSVLFPARWGYAAGASTVDLRAIAKAQADALWNHTAGQWLTAMGALVALSVLFGALAYLRLRHRRPAGGAR